MDGGNIGAHDNHHDSSLNKEGRVIVRTKRRNLPGEVNYPYIGAGISDQVIILDP